MAVDRPIAHRDVIRIRIFHQLVAGLHDARPAGQGDEEHELRDRQRHRHAFPYRGEPERIERHPAAGHDGAIGRPPPAFPAGAAARRSSTLTRAISSRIENGLQR